MNSKLRDNPLSGPGYLVYGFRLLLAPGIKRFVILPLLVNLLLYSLLIALAVHSFDGWMDALLAKLPDWLQWLHYLLWPLFAVALLLAVYFSFSLLANWIGAPFNGLLAEAVSRHLKGEPLPTRAVPLIQEVLQALGDEAVKWFYFALLALPLLILFVIPAVNVVAPFFWLAFGAWLSALEYCDYPLGNRGLRFKQQRRLLKSRRMSSMGFGAAVMTAGLIPLVNFLVMPAAVAGATAFSHHQLPSQKV